MYIVVLIRKNVNNGISLKSGKTYFVLKTDICFANLAPFSIYQSFFFLLLSQKCEYCFEAGATVGCCENRCPENYHFMCGRYDTTRYFDRCNNFERILNGIHI